MTVVCVQLLGDGRDCGTVASTLGGGRSDTIFPFKECSQDPSFLFSNSLCCAPVPAAENSGVGAGMGVAGKWVRGSLGG